MDFDPASLSALFMATLNFVLYTSKREKHANMSKRNIQTSEDLCTVKKEEVYRLASAKQATQNE